MSDSNGSKAHPNIFLKVGAILFVLTAVTVWASSWEIGAGLGLSVALLIAAVKGSLVANYFMHITSEKGIIMIVLLVTLVFFIAVFALPIGEILDHQGYE